ncbi:hypothetical protein GTS_19540 [Gandjariella thermophila]|uniref:Catalytic LigB subunit of aromatic ring-opening dioxygenase n=1 Tax=Gandjariella thermophila TaxID=1931992 RepID=A0A4D4J1G1_9PSEU|nr:hypothetical protein GTS_19540 [Gandjariella thermophila]
MVPHPPLLVPELVAGAAAETEPLRRATVAVAAELAQVAGVWLAVGADPAGPVRIAPHTRGTFAGFGVDVPVTLSADGAAGEADPRLPLPALVAGWLRERAGAERVHADLVPPELPPADCVRLGERLAAEAGGPRPVGLLVLGEGSNQYAEHAQALPDPRAAPFDEQVRDALADADPRRLLDLDVAPAAELGAAGRAAWQVLAGAALASGHEWRGKHAELLNPFGVAYHIAVWDPA